MNKAGKMVLAGAAMVLMLISTAQLEGGSCSVGFSYSSHHRGPHHYYRPMYHRGYHGRGYRSRCGSIHLYGSLWGSYYRPRYPVCRTYHYYSPPVYVYESSPRVIVRESDPVIIRGSRPHLETIDPHPVRVAEYKPVVTYIATQQDLIDELLRGEPEQRLEACAKLIEHPNIRSVAVLIDAMINDADARVRAAAAHSLGEIGDPRAYEALLRSGQAEEDEKVKLAAQQESKILKEKAKAQKIYVGEVFPPMNTGEVKLGEYLEDLRFGEDHQREKAAEKLAKYQGTQTTAALIDTLINDEKGDVREEAAESLGELGDKMALPFLEWAKKRDVDKATKDDAKDAIKDIHQKIQ